MKNVLPNTMAGLSNSADLIERALFKYKFAIGIHHTDADGVRSRNEAFIGAQGEYEQGKQTLAAHQGLMTALTERGRRLAMIARELLKLSLGSRYSLIWDATGYAGSLETPRSFDELSRLMRILSDYLARYTAEENPALHMIAAQTKTISEEMIAARRKFASLQAGLGGLLDVRNDAMQELRRYLRLLVDELYMLLDPMDFRWLEFGLNRPGAKQTPDAPVNVTAKVVNETSAMIEFERPPRADYYRVYQRVVGADAEPVAIGSPADPNFTIEELPRGATVEIFVTAVNSGGESPFSAPVQITTTS